MLPISFGLPCVLSHWSSIPRFHIFHQYASCGSYASYTWLYMLLISSLSNQTNLRIFWTIPPASCLRHWPMYMSWIMQLYVPVKTLYLLHNKFNTRAICVVVNQVNIICWNRRFLSRTVPYPLLKTLISSGYICPPAVTTWTSANQWHDNLTLHVAGKMFELT